MNVRNPDITGPCRYLKTGRAQHEHIKNVTTHPALTGEGGNLHPTSLRNLLYDGSAFIIRITKSHDLHAAIFFSAIVSSVWVLFNVLAALLLRGIGGILNSIFASTRWFYSVDKRPVEACLGTFLLLVGLVIIVYIIISGVVGRM